MSDLKRVNVRVTKEVDDYFTAESFRTGVSKSGLMLLALENYIISRGVSQSVANSNVSLDKMSEFMTSIKQLATSIKDDE